jgi:hypothetical protein
VSLLTELDAFVIEHRRCGEREAGADGPVIWFDCECGAGIARRTGQGPTCWPVSSLRRSASRRKLRHKWN